MLWLLIASREQSNKLAVDLPSSRQLGVRILSSPSLLGILPNGLSFRRFAVSQHTVRNSLATNREFEARFCALDQRLYCPLVPWRVSRPKDPLTSIIG